MRMRVLPTGLYGFEASNQGPNTGSGSDWVVWLLVGVGSAAALGFIFGRVRRSSKPARRLRKELGVTPMDVAFVEARRLLPPDVVSLAAGLG